MFLKTHRDESVEQFFASYQKLQEEVDKEDEEEEEKGKDEKLEAMGEDEFIEKFLTPDNEDEVRDPDEVKCAIKKQLTEVLSVIDKQRSKVGDIIRVLEEGTDAEERSSKLSVMALIHLGSSQKKEEVGEFMFSKIAEICKLASKMEYNLIPHMLQEIMHPTMSYLTAVDLAKVEFKMEEKDEEKRNLDEMALIEKQLRQKAEELQKSGYVLKEGKKSKLGFPQMGLVIKSKMVGNAQLWPCPVEGCIEAFKTSRSCDSHVNIHLGYEYGPCDKCGYTNTHLDSFEKHKCFSNLEEKRGRKRKASAALGSSALESEIWGEKEKRRKRNENEQVVKVQLIR